MKKLIITLFILAGCAKKDEDKQQQPPESNLLNLTINFSATNEVVTFTNKFSSDGKFRLFTYDNYNSKCSAIGQWLDLNKGQTQGTVCVRVTVSQCPHHYINMPISYKYILSKTNEGLFVTVHDSIQNDSQCNFN